MGRPRESAVERQRKRYSTFIDDLSAEDAERLAFFKLAKAFATCKYKSKRDEWIDFAREIMRKYPDRFDDLLSRLKEKYQ